MTDAKSIGSRRPARMPAGCALLLGLALAAPAARGVETGPRTVTTRRAGELLVEAVVQVESAGNPRAVSRSGARGLMQLKKPAWDQMARRVFGRRVSFERAFDPRTNLILGTAYLRWLQEFMGPHRARWRADERALLLAGYHAGPNAVKDAGFSLRRLPRATRSYVARVSALHDALVAEETASAPTTLASTR